MGKSIHFWRIAALAAAYVLVLQALLLPLAVAAGARMAEGLCISSGADTQSPVNHDTGCACAAGCGAPCCAQGLLGTASGLDGVALTGFYVMMPGLAPEPVAQSTLRSPQNPRAPPAV